MLLATQYFRPPFPEKRFWKDDLARMRDAGLNALQLWAVWGWIEPEPGQYRFRDYDSLVEEAGRVGLQVVISSIAEIHPFWLPRLVPDGHLVDHMGRAVISSCRGECNVGLTPGGCTDHPEVRKYMHDFLTALSSHYAGTANLAGWDAWNETRWAVQADGHVCYCPHTIKSFRNWLETKYKDLETLSEAWQRRYCSWEDVQPGKLPLRPYTEMMEFLRFLTWRAKEHMHFRYAALRQGDPKHFISAHCATPATLEVAEDFEQVMCRGNDWEHADQLDGYGCSHFPFWGGVFDETGFGLRVESIRSAARGKTMWVSELQGGSARDAIVVHPSVPAAPQQRWVWNGYGRGAKAVIFWCWRDEVFGVESSGFGLAGNDGLAEERLAALRRSGDALQRHHELLEAYLPDDPEVGVLFEPDTYYLDWSCFGKSEHATQSLSGYATALERLEVPYEVLESSHLALLPRLKVVFMPWPLVVKPGTAETLLAWVKNGGVLFTEAELDAYTPNGFYRYSGPDRPFAHALGVRDAGRRMMDSTALTVGWNEQTLELQLGGWKTPLEAGAEGVEVLAADEQRQPLLLRRRVGKGWVYACGSFLGLPYQQQPYADFEQIITAVLQQGQYHPALRIETSRQPNQLQWRTGRAGKQRLLFVLNMGGDCLINVHGDRIALPANGQATELLSDATIALVPDGAGSTFSAELSAGGVGVFSWQE